MSCFAHGNFRYERFDHLKSTVIVGRIDLYWRQLASVVFWAPENYFCAALMVCLDHLCMSQLYTKSGDHARPGLPLRLFNSYTTIFSIVLYLVFFVVIAPVSPNNIKKSKRLTLLMKISAWCTESCSILHNILSIFMFGICGLDRCSLQTAFTSFIE